MKPIKQTPTTLITGFLGAGKTTLLNALLMHKPPTQKWALLINEFGKIGVDTALIDGQDGVFVKEVSGGCICCSSQLPMQVAVVRLLSQQVERLLIEPTGLSHAKELLEQFGAAHWQSSLALGAVICVVNARQWQQPKYRQHVAYQAHVKYADVVVLNQSQSLSTDECQQLCAWIRQFNHQAVIIEFEQVAQALDVLFAKRQASSTALVYVPLTITDTERQDNPDDEQPLPYHYHECVGDYVVGGWRLPAFWTFDEHKTQNWLLSLVGYERIKGVIHTSSGWLSVNMTPTNMAMADIGEGLDNRLEMIVSKQSQHANDWQACSAHLLTLLVSQ